MVCVGILDHQTGFPVALNDGYSETGYPLPTTVPMHVSRMIDVEMRISDALLENLTGQPS
jgi:hypothetical protein